MHWEMRRKTTAPCEPKYTKISALSAFKNCAHRSYVADNGEGYVTYVIYWFLREGFWVEFEAVRSITANPISEVGHDIRNNREHLVGVPIHPLVIVIFFFIFEQLCLDCFTFLKIGMSEVCALRMPLVIHVFNFTLYCTCLYLFICAIKSYYIYVYICNEFRRQYVFPGMPLLLPWNKALYVES